MREGPIGPGGPWRKARPEMIIAEVTVIVTAVAGYAVAGWAGLAVVAVVAAALALLVIRFLLPRGVADAAREAREKRTARPVSGYSHRRFVVQNAIQHGGRAVLTLPASALRRGSSSSWNCSASDER